MWLLNKKVDEKKWEEMNKKVLVLAREKKTEEALELAQQLFKYSKKTYGKNHKKTVKVVNNLGFIFMQKKDFDEAEAYLLMALQISEKVYGKYSREVALVNVNLSKLYMEKAQEIAHMESAYDGDEYEDKADTGNLAKAY